MEIPLFHAAVLVFDAICIVWLAITLRRTWKTRKVLYSHRVQLLRTLASIRDSPVSTPEQRAEAEMIIRKIARRA